MFEWLWISAIVLFLLIEAATMALVSVWFAGGSIVALIATLLGADFTVQMIVFLSVSFVLLLLLRQIAVKGMKGNRSRTNLDRIVGERVIALEDVDNFQNTGSVKIGDVVWRARSSDGSIIQKGESATVADIDGVKLILKR